jgi:hypothetical protein
MVTARSLQGNAMNINPPPRRQSEGEVDERIHKNCSPVRAGFFGRSSRVARDSRGNLYAMDLCLGKFQRLVHDFPFRSMKVHEYESMAWLREGHLIRHQSELGSLARFGPGGGDRGAESEHWAHRGFSVVSSGNCKCDWPAETVAVDAADRIFARRIVRPMALPQPCR